MRNVFARTTIALLLLNGSVCPCVAAIAHGDTTDHEPGHQHADGGHAHDGHGTQHPDGNGAPHDGDCCPETAGTSAKAPKVLLQKSAPADLDDDAAAIPAAAFVDAVDVAAPREQRRPGLAPPSHSPVDRADKLTE